MRSKADIASVAIVAFCAGAAVSFFTLPVWIAFLINFAKEGSRTDWLGFSGSIIGALVALIAAIVAWFAVQRQITAQEDANALRLAYEQQSAAARQTSAKHAAIVVLTNPVQSAAVSLRVARQAKKQHEKPERLTNSLNWQPQMDKIMVRFAASMSGLKAVTSHFALSQTWQDLSTADRNDYLIITSTLHTAVTLFEHSPSSLPMSRLIDVLIQVLSELSKHVRRLDPELADSFDRSSQKE